MTNATIIKQKKARQARKRNTLALFLLGAGLLVFGIAALLVLPRQGVPPSNGEALPESPAKVKYPAPDLTLEDLQGIRNSLSDSRGQVVLVNHWATWCPPCRAELPELEAYYQAHKGEGFRMIGIEAGEPAEQVNTFVKSYSLTYPVWADPNQEAMEAFQIQGLPSSFVIDQEGIVRLAWYGVVTSAALEKYVTPMLEQ